ncbi:choline binding A domain protein [Streptococcus pneumoniae GA47283]|nr:choline binding A domain protein [Streptococcus pneumoniae GA47283]
MKVKEAELELVKKEADESRNEGTINQAKAKVESEQAEATRLKKSRQIVKKQKKKLNEEQMLKSKMNQRGERVGENEELLESKQHLIKKKMMRSLQILA